jgi:hypothetical protein
MNKSLRIAFILVALGVAFGSVIAQQQRKPPILGGYKEISTDDPAVQAAAEFAVNKQGENQSVTIKLVSVEKAESQVVAGRNFRLCLKVEVNDDSAESETEEVKVVVYQNLKQEYSLTSWDVEDCGGSSDN